MTSLTSVTRSRPPTHRLHTRSPSAVDERSDDLLVDGVTVRRDSRSVEPHAQLAASGRERHDDVLVGGAPPESEPMTEKVEPDVLAVPTHPPDAAPCQRQPQLARGVAIAVEREARWDVPEIPVAGGEQLRREARRGRRGAKRPRL